MAAQSSVLVQLDEYAARLVADWDIYSTLITTVLAVFLGYAFITYKEPDIHPFFLAQQSQEAPLRNPGESAAFRALESPHGYPLKRGLNIKDADTPKWTSGRSGDLRDIWRAAVRGSVNELGHPKWEKSSIYTVLGKNVIEHSMDEVSKQMNIIGQYIHDLKVQTVGVCLANSEKLIATIFAGSFYGFKVVIIPHHLSSELLALHLKVAKVDLLVTAAGVHDLSILLQTATDLKHAILIAEESSKDMDWSHSIVDSSEWSHIISTKQDSVGPELPPSNTTLPLPSLALFSDSSPNTPTLVEFSQQNLLSGISGFTHTLPRSLRITSTDLVFPIDCLHRPYPLCIVLAALFSNASIVVNPVASEDVNFALATTRASPSIIVSSSKSVSNYYEKLLVPCISLPERIGRWIQKLSLNSGIFPKQNFLTRLTNTGTAKTLRLLIISHNVNGDPNDQLTSEQLSDLRIFLGARTVYALSALNVAGGISQTNPFDYRTHKGYSHFGGPLSSVELKLVSEENRAKNGRIVEGDINIAGPPVAAGGGQTSLGIKGRIEADHTLALV